MWKLRKFPLISRTYTDINEIIFRFSMVDQLVEGHQWLKNTLNYKPKSSWSVDPFGHGAAFPYILKSSGIDGKTRLQFNDTIWVKSNVFLKAYLIVYGATTGATIYAFFRQNNFSEVNYFSLNCFCPLHVSFLF